MERDDDFLIRECLIDTNLEAEERNNDVPQSVEEFINVDETNINLLTIP